MSILTRRKSDCNDHKWVTTVSSGLRSNICRRCNAITLEPVRHEFSVPVSLQKVAASAR